VWQQCSPHRILPGSTSQDLSIVASLLHRDSPLPFKFTPLPAIPLSRLPIRLSICSNAYSRMSARKPRSRLHTHHDLQCPIFCLQMLHPQRMNERQYSKQSRTRSCRRRAEEMQAEIVQPDAGQAKRLALLQEFICVHRSLLVRIRNLPPELLQEIFLVYSETSTGYHRWIRPPFVLGQICRSWRQTAISLPALWDKLPAFQHEIFPSRVNDCFVPRLLVSPLSPSPFPF
jgi:hypothetical protein